MTVATGANHGAAPHDDEYHKRSVEFFRDMMRRLAPAGMSFREFITTPNPKDGVRGASMGMAAADYTPGAKNRKA